MGEYTIKQRDYLDTLKACEDAGGVDLVATSPPYADARTYGMDCSFTDADYQRLAHGLWSALRPGGHALINLDAPVRDWAGDGRGTERGLHPWRFMLYAHDVVGFRVPDRLAFGRAGLPGAYAGRFRNDWEPLLWLQKPGADGFFDRTTLDIRTRPYATKGGSMNHGERKETNRKHNSAKAIEGVAGRGTFWNYGSVGHGNTGAPDIEAAGHEARWPYKLARDIVLCFCPVNGIVCDPFVGAGTTMIAALEEGRKFIGGDLGKRRRDNKDWIEIAREIAVNRNKQTTLFG